MNYEIKDTIIVINSSHRAGKIITNEEFPTGIIKVVIAVPSDQADTYCNCYGNMVVPIPMVVKQTLPAQRQWCMEHFGGKYKYIWLMDDDLKFFHRKDGKLHQAHKEHIEVMFELVRLSLDFAPMVGISTRLGNNRVSAEFEEINRVTRCYAMDSAVYKSVGCRFDPIDYFVAEDFHVALCFLNKGYKNRILYSFAQEDGGSNKGGGCSLYRTAEVQKRTSLWMTANHPEVRIKAKPSKNWNNMEGLKGDQQYRVDMIVGWKKAYKPRPEKTRKGLFG